jgi:cell division protein FtsQ
LAKDRSPRRRPETTTQTRQRFRRGVRWSLFLPLFPILFTSLGAYLVSKSSLLTVQHIRVEGATSLDRASLVSLSALDGESMLRLPKGDAARRISELPGVRSVSIDRSWPSTVTIKVEERTPVAFWSVGDEDYAVDEEGVVLSGRAPNGLSLRIVQVDAGRVLKPGDRVDPDAIAFAQRIMAESPRFLGESVVELEYSAGVGLTVIFDGGMRVAFGDERSYDYKIAVLSELLQELSNEGIQPKTVDLRFGERVTYE